MQIMLRKTSLSEWNVNSSFAIFHLRRRQRAGGMVGQGGINYYRRKQLPIITVLLITQLRFLQQRRLIRIRILLTKTSQSVGSVSRRRRARCILIGSILLDLCTSVCNLLNALTCVDYLLVTFLVRRLNPEADSAARGILTRLLN
jgi:hypothetical protein